MPSHLIIVACPNETIRKTSAEKTLDLALIDLRSNIGVLIQDNKGNASLTCVDLSTNLDFIRDEIKWMDGPYTIDIIEGTEYDSLITPDAFAMLKELNLDRIPNSKGEFKVRKSKTGFVLLRESKLLVLEPKFLDDLSVGKASIDNPLKKDIVSPGPNPNLRIYTRQINASFSYNNKTVPTIAYADGQWCHNFPSLLLGAQHFLASLTSFDSAYLTQRLERLIIIKKLDAVKQLLAIQSLCYVIPKYLELTRANPADHLNTTKTPSISPC